MITYAIVTAIVLFTLWVKKDEWFGATKRPATTSGGTRLGSLSGISEYIPELKISMWFSWLVKQAEKKPVQIAAMWLLVGLGLMFSSYTIVPYRNSGDIWTDLILSPRGAYFIVGFTVLAYILPENEKNPFRLKFARFLMVTFSILVTLSVWQAFGNKLPTATIGEKAGGIFGTLGESTGGLLSKFKGIFGGTTTEASSLRPLSKAQVQKIVNEFWYSNKPAREAEIMVNIAGKESGFRHWDEKTGEVLRGEKNPMDRGVMQVNLVHSAKEIAECKCDPLTLEGNLDVALRVYNKYGAVRWTALSKVIESEPILTEITAPVERWTDWIKVGPDCHGTSDKLVKVQGDRSDEEYDLEPEKEPPTFGADLVRYKSLEEPPAKVLFKCR